MEIWTNLILYEEVESNEFQFDSLLREIILSFEQFSHEC